MSRPAEVVIDLSALRHNFSRIRNISTRFSNHGHRQGGCLWTWYRSYCAIT